MVNAFLGRIPGATVDVHGRADAWKEPDAPDGVAVGCELSAARQTHCLFGRFQREAICQHSLGISLRSPYFWAAVMPVSNGWARLTPPPRSTRKLRRLRLTGMP